MKTTASKSEISRIQHRSPPPWQAVPLFWLELFDHSIKMSLDRGLKTLFLYSTDFISAAAGLNKPGGPDDR